MAAKKTNWGAIAVVVGIVGVAWYLLSRKKAAAGGGGGAYGGGGGTPLFPGGNSRSPAGGTGVPNVGVPASSFGGPSLAQRIQSLLGFVRAGNAAGMLLPSSNAYLPGLGTSPDFSIPMQPTNLFDLSQVAQPIQIFDTSSISPTDLSLSNFSIPYDSFNMGGIDPNSFLQTQDIQYQPSDTTTSYDFIDTNPDLNFGLDPYAAYQGQYDPTNPNASGY